MINILLIEDEKAAARRLARMVGEILPEANIVAQLESVEEVIEWWEQHPKPDLLLMDIHLADGSAFEILAQLSIEQPIIFSTAYDEYAIQAFKHNSIDYLLKPVKEEELVAALDKFKKQQTVQTNTAIDYQALAQAIQQKENTRPKRLLIRFAQQLKAVEIDQVAYFYIEERVCFLCTHQGKRYPLDQTLDQLIQMLDPQRFFRVNRQLITNVASIQKMYTWSKSRIKIELAPKAPVEAIVSSERSAQFKTWLKGARNI